MLPLNKVLGCWFQLRADCVPLNPIFPSLHFLGISAIASVTGLFASRLGHFSLTLTVASRLLHPYGTDDKTSTLMVKRFSTVRDTQRSSQSYMEKRRGRREIEVTRRGRGEVRREETNLVSNKFPKCFPQARTPRKIHRIK